MKGGLDPDFKKNQYIQLAIVLSFIWAVLLFIVFLAGGRNPAVAMYMVFFGAGLTVVLGAGVVLWAVLFYDSFSYEIGPEFVKINKGVVTKKEVRIPYERIQDVNTVRGIIQRQLGIATIQIQTAGTAAVPSSPGTSAAEGEIPGVREPQKIIDAIMAKVLNSRGKPDGLGGEKKVSLLILEELKKISKKLK